MSGRGKRMSDYVKRLIIDYNSKGMSPVKITNILSSRHHINFTRRSVGLFLQKQKTSTSLNQKVRIEKPRKITKIHYDLLQVWLNENPEQTARDIQIRFFKVCDLSISVSKVKVMRRKLNWSAKQRRYGQMISAKNRKIRVDWCLSALTRNETFSNVIFVDETCVEMCSSGRIFFHQKSMRLECPTLKVAKPKHPYKVNVWAGISYRGRTNICVFTGIMDSVSYQQILERNFLPFVSARFPDGYRLYQDNDSKHKSRSTVQWMERNNVADKVMVVPASSPDLNPIENVWASMKDHLGKNVKPKLKEELVAGIVSFWEEHLTDLQCASYIDHIHKAIPRTILNHGWPSGL